MSCSNVNLVPAHRRDAKQRRVHVRRCAIGCGAFGLLLLAACVASRAAWGGDDATLAVRIQQADEEARRAERDAEVARIELAAVESVLEASRTNSGQPDWGFLLALLAEQTGDDVMLRHCKLVPAAADVTAVAAKPAAAGGTANGTATGTGTSAATARPPAYILRLGGLARTQLARSQFVLRLEQAGLF